MANDKPHRNPKRAAPPAARPAEDAGSTLANVDSVLLAEAQRRGREVLAHAESSMAEYGQWLLAQLFADDARAVLDREIVQPVWLALVRAAESARMPLGRATITNALRVAAYDKRLADGAWDRLSYSHKVALLPLASPKEMRAAARHALAASLSVRQCAAYVSTLLPEDSQRKRLSPVGARRALRALHGRFERAQDVKRFASQLSKLDDEARDEAAAELESLLEALTTVLDSVRVTKAK